MLKITVELYYYNVAIILLLILISFKPLYEGCCTKPFLKGQNNSLFFFTNFVLLLLFLVFQFTEYDFLQYWKIFNGNIEIVEPLQRWILDKFDNFYLWRLTVWGGAFYVFLLAFKRLTLNPRVYFPLFVLGYLSRFISREQLGIAIMFLGSTYIVKPLKSKFISYAIGMGLIFASYYFHNSMIISIAILIPAFFKLTPNRAILVLGLFVPLMNLFNYLMSDALLMDYISNTSTNMDERIEIYTNQVTTAMNFNGLIRQVIYWSPMVLMLGDVIYRSSRKYNAVQLPKEIKYYLSYWFYMFILSFVFFWLSVSAYIPVRLLDKSLFAMVVVLSYWFSIQKPNKIMKASLWLFLIYNCLNYFLIIYKAS